MMTTSEAQAAGAGSLSGREREWIEWILPADRSGYGKYRDLIASMIVIGEGRRGKGELILGYGDQPVDFSTPLAPVFAYGAIETSFGTISITIRELMDNQISVEIVGHRFDDVPREFEESRRWTYSTWCPGNSCPQCRMQVRQIPMHAVTDRHEHFTLAICSNDRRMWVYDESNRVNRLIPATNYYNELMLHKNIRDPKVALDSKRLFTELSSFSDEDLTYAFLTYNKLKTKVQVHGTIEPEKQEAWGFLGKLKEIFLKK